MKLKKLMFAEIALVVVVLVSAMIFIQITSYLGPPQKNAKIGMYVEKEYAKGTLTIVPGELAFVQFNYTSYEPAILVLELTFQSWASAGLVDVRCNNRPMGPILAEPSEPTVRLTMITFSGAEWVEPISSMFGLNELIFESDLENGFEGVLSYRIMLRGSR